MNKRRTSPVAFEFRVIGHVQSPFQTKFGIPRQSGLALQTKGIIQFDADHRIEAALRGLEGFSHLWIIFVFHQHGAKDWKPSIRPPRLGGKEKIGVLASRSPHRPNPIGLSVVEIEKIVMSDEAGPQIHIRGHDLLDGTPVLDIKPYLPYADARPEASPGWAAQDITKHDISFSGEAQATLHHLDPDETRSLRALVIGVLELDPRPAFQQRKHPVLDPASSGRRYGFAFHGLEIQYEIRSFGFHVISIETLNTKPEVSD